MAINIGLLYASLEPNTDSEETRMLLVREPDAARNRARELGLPDTVGEIIYAALQERCRQDDREDFPLGVAMLSIELMLAAGLEVFPQGQTAQDEQCPFRLVPLAPKVAVSLVADAAAGIAVSEGLERAIRKATRQRRRRRSRPA